MNCTQTMFPRINNFLQQLVGFYKVVKFKLINKLLITENNLIFSNNFLLTHIYNLLISGIN